VFSMGSDWHSLFTQNSPVIIAFTAGFSTKPI